MAITLEEIKRILDGHTSAERTLSLPPGAFGQGQIAAAFKDYLLNQDLVVRQAQSVLIPNVNVTVVGFGSSFPFASTSVTAVFTVRDGEAALALDAAAALQGPDAWSLDKAFPALAKTFYKRLKFSEARLILRSYDVSARQPKGLHLAASLELAGRLSVIKSFLNGENPVALAGAVELHTAGLPAPPDAVPVMTIESVNAGEVSIGSFRLRIAFQLADGAFVNDKGVVMPLPELRMVSALSVQRDGGEPFEISVRFTDEVGVLTFQMADLGPGVTLGLQALNSLANGTDLQRLLPAQMPFIDRFLFKNWSLTVDPRDMSLKAIALGVETARPWEVIPGLLTLERIKFQFVIANLIGRFETHAELNAEVGIGEGAEKFVIVVDAFYPSYFIAGSLDRETPIDLKLIARKFLGNAVADTLPDTLQVTLLNLTLDPVNRAFTLELIVTTDWLLDLGIAQFTLNNIGFQIAYEAGAASGGVSAAFLVGPPDKGFEMAVSAFYDAAEKGWLFSGELSPDTPITLKDLIDTYLPEQFRQFEPPQVSIKTLAASFDSGLSKAYSFKIGVEWRLTFGDGIEFVIGGLAEIGSRLLPDKTRAYKGFVRGTLDYEGIALEVELQFDQQNTAYVVRFQGFEGVLKTVVENDQPQRVLEVSMKGKTLGGLITTLVNAVAPGSGVTLEAPWSALNSLSLDTFVFRVNFTAKKVGFTYEPNLNLGFASIGKLGLEYDTQNKTIMFRLLRGRFLDKQITENQPVGWNVLNPGETQQVPGQGTRLFQLQFLGLGQHVRITGKPQPRSVLEAVGQMESAFKTPPGGSGAELAFDDSVNWLIGTRFTVVEAFNFGVVFYDPEMYGLVISADGAKAVEKAGIFKGLRFEILYKKVSETVGVYQIDLKLPDAIRQLDFGSVSVTLPNLKLLIYTNGDFLVDLGFPENEDFARSFSVQVLPFTGSGGLYFGKLSGETARQLPRLPDPPLGSFNPVIVFGVGLRVGLGKEINKGILKAGLSLTVQGILEGTIAFYNPFDPDAPEWIQEAKYYYIQGKLSIVGRVYGSIDFAIISARLDITVFISVRVVMEAYEALLLYFSAGISVSLEVKVNLGIFSIKVNFSFKATIEQSFTIGSSDPVKPWDPPTLPPRRRQYLPALDDASDPCSGRPLPVMKWQPVLRTPPQEVPLFFAPQFTAAVDGPLGQGQPRTVKCVAMTYVRSKPLGASTDPTPFDQLAQGVLVWTLNALLNAGQSGTTYADIIDKVVTREQLQDIYCVLSRKDALEPFRYEEVEEFLAGYFRFTVTLPPAAADAEESVSVFPALPLLTLKTSTGVDNKFSEQTPSSPEYLDSIKRYFDQLAARFENSPPEAAGGPAPAPLEATQPLPTFIFTDFFALLAKSAVQSAMDLMDSLEIDPGASSLAALAADNPHFNISPTELAFVNRLRRLGGGLELSVPGAAYVAKRGDTLERVAGRFGCGVEELRGLNPHLGGRPLEPATRITLGRLTHTTGAGGDESLLGVANAYGVSVERLAEANADVPGLFARGQRLVVPFVEQMKVGELVQALQDAGSFDDLSGLSARTLLQGLRPPSPADSIYQGAPTPLYQLSGQQFDASALAAGDTISLHLDAALPWFELKNDEGNGLYVEFTMADKEVTFLEGLRTSAFSPAQQFEPADLFRIQPRSFTLPSYINWQTPSEVPMANAAPRGTSIVEPTLWKFSNDLQQLVTGEHAISPRMQLFRQVQEDASHLTDPVVVGNFSWSTFFGLSVRQTPVPDAPEGVMPFVYEVQALEGGAGLLLQNLLTYYSQHAPCIERLQLLYPLDPAVQGQQEPAVGLKSDADPTVFLLQTNLSTASNPPQTSAAAGPAARQLAGENLVGMTDIEFLKLLWEAGVVMSGGYYLYYDAGGRGLPDYLFNDDGVARLTVLVTYDITDGLVRDFLNSVTVREQIDLKHEVLFLRAEPLLVEGAALAAGESLEAFARRHRVSVSKLAAHPANGRVKLTPGVEVRVPPRTHRVKRGETFGRIAAAHGVTEASVAGLNPGLDPESPPAGAFLKLPAVVHRTAEGDTLRRLGRRFGASLIALAHANRRTPGLFAGALSFDYRLEDKISNIPPGNVGFRLRRTNPDGPAQDAAAPLADVEKQLAGLYNLLEYRVAGQGVFTESNPALPVGPAVEDEGEGLNLKARPLPAPELVEYWMYEAVVPVSPFVKPAGEGEPAAGLPAPSENPYAGVGETAVLTFNWQDLFGNWIDVGAAGRKARVGLSWPDQGFFVGYTDPLVAVEQWPSVNTAYVIEESGGPTLSVFLQFYPGKYLGDGGRDLALNDLQTYRRVYYQLSQPDAAAEVSATLGGVTPKGDPPLAPKEALKEFAGGIFQFLKDVADGVISPPVPLPLTLPFSVADANPKNIFELQVSLKIRRDPDLVSDEFKDVPSVTEVSTLIPPHLTPEATASAEEEPPPPLSLQEFAQKIEAAFPSLKVLSGVPRSSLGERVRDIWIARFDDSETGIAFTVATARPLYYAVKPLAVTLLSDQDVPVYPYRSGAYIGDETPVAKAFSGVDLELLAVNFLAAVDRVLQPDYAVPLWLLENQAPPQEPDPFARPFQSIIEAKKKLAAAISGHVTNVFEGEAGDAENLRSAREKLRQELLIQLSNAYTVDTIVEFDVTVEHSEYGSDCPNPPLLFGTPVAQAPEPREGAAENAYAFSTAKLSLSNVADASKLTFLFSTRSRKPEDAGGAADEPFFAVSLDYRASAIEEPAAAEVPGIKGYRPSDWLMFVLPFAARELGELKIPIPLRAYPPPPSLTEQGFEPKLPQFVGARGQTAPTPLEQLEEARKWSYRFTYEYVGAAQDTIHVNVKINTLQRPPLPRARAADGPTLFEALLQFSQAYPGIAADLDNQLVEGGDPLTALNAARSFAWLASRAADAWSNWDADSRRYAGRAQESPEFEFEILEQPEPHEAGRILKVTVTAGGAGMTVPLVRVPGYETEPASPPAGARECSYLFYREADGVKEYLSFAGARKINRREAVFSDFDVMDIENAWAGAFVVRNESLVPGKTTNPVFKYQTPVIRFVNPLTPALDPALEINVGDFTPDAAGVPHTLETLLANFFTALFNGISAVATARTVKLGGSYRYNVQDPSAGGPELPATLPVFQTLPAPFEVGAGGAVSPENAFVAAVSEATRGWVSAHRPRGLGSDGRLYFDLSIFSSLSETKLPVLRLRNLYLYAAQVVWELPR